MRVAAVILCWDDWEMLSHCIKNISPLVDGVIVIGSETSNYGEFSEAPQYNLQEAFYYLKEPNLTVRPEVNERDKRNFGLNVARKKGFTHFLMMDSDEFYEHEPFLKEKERFLNPDLNGLVCASQVYFKSPKLTIGLDTTRVTFIHKITPDLRFEFNKKFPFAFDVRGIYIDPTRQLNITSGVEWSNIVCHHFSWVRKDYEKKIRNSTARVNIEHSTIRQDLMQAKPGYFCQFYGKTLATALVYFNLPEFDVDKDLQPIPTGSSEGPNNK